MPLAIDYGTLPDGSDIYTLRAHQYPGIAVPISADYDNNDILRALQYIDALTGHNSLAHDSDTHWVPIAIYALGDDDHLNGVLVGGQALPDLD